MSMHSYYKYIVNLLLILMVALSIPLGIFETSKYGYAYIFESYKEQITLNEDYVFDDEMTLLYYDAPVILTAGMTGTIDDVVDYYMDDYGKDYMRVVFRLSNGKAFETVISMYPKSTDEFNRSKNGKYINISSIDSSQKVIQAYKESRAKFNMRKQKLEIAGPVISGSLSVLLAIGGFIVQRILIKKDKSIKLLMKVILFFDIVLIIWLIVDISIFKTNMLTTIV